MLKRLALCAALLAPATPAWALGLGTTLGVGSGLFIGDPGGGGGYNTTPGGFLPTLDLHFGDIALQLHVLETIAGLGSQDFFVGANVYFGIPVGSIGGGWEAMIAPGAGLDLFFDPFGMGITAETQFGVQLPNAVSIGIYIVPALGIFVAEGGDASLIAAGTLQMTIWWNIGGGGGGRSSSGSSGGSGSGGSTGGESPGGGQDTGEG